MDPITQFVYEREERIAGNGQDHSLYTSARNFLNESLRAKYSYNFSWLGRPIIQYPQDIMALQEIIWELKPEIIIETGIAHGGSLIFYASMLELLGGQGIAVGIDVDIRAHNRAKIEDHPLYRHIVMIEGSSVNPKVVDQVRTLTTGCRTVMVCLDSNHTHEHVLQELEVYAPLVTLGSYLIVFDGIIENMPNNLVSDRQWGQGDNPLTAIRQFLRENSEFEIDKTIEQKLLITAAPMGYLKRIR